SSPRARCSSTKRMTWRVVALPSASKQWGAITSSLSRRTMQLKPFEPSLSFEYPFGPSTYTVALSATGGPAASANAICTSGGVWASILRMAASADPSTGPDSKRLSETNGNDSIDAPPWQAVAPMSVGRPSEGCTTLDESILLGL